MLTLIFCLLLSVLLYVHWRELNKFPGPPRIPVLGSLPWLSFKRGLLDWVLLPRVTKTRASCIQVGFNNTIYALNDYEMAKALFTKDVFSLRVADTFLYEYRFLEPFVEAGIIWSNGDQWSTQRRFSLKTLRDFGFGKQSLEALMNLEIDDMIAQFSATPGEDIRIGSDFNLPIINILWQIVAGRRITPDDRDAVRMVELVNSLFSQSRWFAMLPMSVAKLFPKLTRLHDRGSVLTEHKVYLMKIINEHKQTYDPADPRDFIDVYLTKMREDEDKYTEGDLCSILMDFFHAGTETTSTTLKWMLLFMTVHQDYQTACRSEIHEKIGENRPKIPDLSQLPFTQAMLTEIQRVSCVAPMSLPHVASEDFTYDGFTFPKGAVVHANLSSIMKDPTHFKDPDVFNPYRFIDGRGNFVKNERIVPFGIGKRFCMGEQLARNEFFLFAVNLVQRLRFLPASRHPLPDRENFVNNFTCIPADFYVKIQPL